MEWGNIDLKKKIEKLLSFFENRNFILAAITVIIGCIYIITLFSIQVINGEEYREQSQKKILRNETIIAARGEITDRNGVLLATNKWTFDLQLYKVDVTNEQQNIAILETIKILEENKDEIYSSFPINDAHNNFDFETQAEEENWKEEMEFEYEDTFNQIIDYYIDRYSLSLYVRDDAIKIIMIRYEASLMGYSLFRPVTIATDISNESLAQIEEKSFELYGMSTVSVPKRYYPEGMLAAHTIGYVSKISSSEYTDLKDLRI